MSSISSKKPENRNHKLKICLVCSHGGHLKQMRKLELVYLNRPHFLITTTSEAQQEILCFFKTVYLVKDIDQGRWRKHPLRLLIVFAQMLLIFLREKPGFILSTGSGIAVPAFLLARLFRARAIYVEAGARTQSLSLAGRVCYYLSDLFFVQYSGLASKFPRAVYRGTLYEHLLG